jgi:hypothetical protein
LPTNSRNQSYGWHFQYLTIIALALATATFTFGLLADMTGSQRWFRYKNTLSVCSAPLELLVTFLYFGIKSVGVLVPTMEINETNPN